jgi:Pyruvate/2-oxoacid:ferredoxin oxidoreductase delta subunit
LTVRGIVRIDEEKCNGCGECIPRCDEGALRIVDGKARLVGDVYCDGLGACLGTCPQDAITIVQREADDFDEEAVREHLAREERPSPPPPQECGCPGAALMQAQFEDEQTTAASSPQERPSALRQWPVQLTLVPVRAPFFDGADLLLAADCAPFALAGFHDRLLQGRRLLVGCPKLDDAEAYTQKLAEILKQNDVHSLTVVHMEVPCCHGLMGIARRAIARSGATLPLDEMIVSVRGEAREGVSAART